MGEIYKSYKDYLLRMHPFSQKKKCMWTDCSKVSTHDLPGKCASLCDEHFEELNESINILFNKTDKDVSDAINTKKIEPFTVKT